MSDLTELQRGLAERKPVRNGMHLYTADMDSVSLCDFYRGGSAFLVLSGPSFEKVDQSLLARRGVITMGVNNSWASHRPNLWTAVDPPGRFLDVGWYDPAILKFVPLGGRQSPIRTRQEADRIVETGLTAAQMPSVLFYRRSDHFDHRTFLTEDTVNWGNGKNTADTLGITGKRSVMLAALKLLHYLGFAKVYLLGADFKMDAEHGYSFDEARTEKAAAYNNSLYRDLDRRFKALLPHFEENGFQVINCTQPSGLTAFEYMPLAEAVTRATRECSKPIEPRGWYAPVEAAAPREKLDRSHKPIMQPWSRVSELLGSDTDPLSDDHVIAMALVKSGARSVLELGGCTPLFDRANLSVLIRDRKPAKGERVDFALISGGDTTAHIATATSCLRHGGLLCGRGWHDGNVVAAVEQGFGRGNVVTGGTGVWSIRI